MASFEYYLRFVQAGLDELENYLLSDDLFWPVNLRGDGYPKLTVGNMRLFMIYLEASIDTPADDAQFSRIETEMFAITKRWQAAWERKAEHEFTSRLRQWANFLEEMRKNPKYHADFYSTEVRLRVLLELLGEILPDPPESPAVLDEHILAVFEPDGFLWDQNFQECFPPEAYWFLYGKLAAEETTHS